MEQMTHSSQLIYELLEHPDNWNYQRVTQLIEAEKANIPTLFPAKDRERTLLQFISEIRRSCTLEQRAHKISVFKSLVTLGASLKQFGNELLYAML